MARVRRVAIADLIFDDGNANKGTERGGELLAQSVRTFGLGRSILIDADNRVIAGNKTLKTAIGAGVTTVVVIEASGNELVAVRRQNVDLDTAAGRQMALLDNRTGQLNQDLDIRVIARQAADLGITLDELGITPAESREMARANAMPGEATGSLAERWGVPPFTVLDGRQDYWQERADGWAAQSVRTDEVWDVVLAELLIRWFSPPDGGKVAALERSQTLEGVAVAMGRNLRRLDQPVARIPRWRADLALTSFSGPFPSTGLAKLMDMCAGDSWFWCAANPKTGRRGVYHPWADIQSASMRSGFKSYNEAIFVRKSADSSGSGLPKAHILLLGYVRGDPVAAAARCGQPQCVAERDAGGGFVVAAGESAGISGGHIGADAPNRSADTGD